jgi:hypothetical protein
MRTTFLHCIVATICSYLCWSGALQQLFTGVMQLISWFLGATRGAEFNEGPGTPHLSALTDCAERLKGLLEGLREAGLTECNESDHSAVYEQVLVVLKRNRMF